MYSRQTLAAPAAQQWRAEARSEASGGKPNEAFLLCTQLTQLKHCYERRGGEKRSKQVVNAYLEPVVAAAAAAAVVVVAVVAVVAAVLQAVFSMSSPL